MKRSTTKPTVIFFLFNNKETILTIAYQNNKTKNINIMVWHIIRILQLIIYVIGACRFADCVFASRLTRTSTIFLINLECKNSRCTCKHYTVEMTLIFQVPTYITRYCKRKC